MTKQNKDMTMIFSHWPASLKNVAARFFQFEVQKHYPQVK